jgi:UDP-3-O-[3-hydroxymyristoyl] glucosamine N-acyltransferase
MTVQMLAELVQGQVHGDGEQEITAASPLHLAGPGHISFVENERNIRNLKGCSAIAVLVPQSLLAKKDEITAARTPPLTLVAVADALAAFVTVLQRLNGPEPVRRHGIDTLASVHPTAVVGADTDIHPFAVVGEGSRLGARCTVHSGVVIGRNCRMGDDVVLHPNVVLYDNTVLGNRVIVHANSVLAADGFGYRFHEGRHLKVPQLGTVEVEDDVEIGACTTIDRGTFAATRIGQGTKIDNLVQIGHNCQIGRHNLFVSQVGIAGSTETGNYVVLAGQVGLADHLHIADGTQIGARAGVHKDTTPGERLLGTPARPEREAKRILMCLDRLPNLCKDVARILQQLGITPEGARSEDRKPEAGAA